jgi:uncharacterized protein with HEPN domain
VQAGENVAELIGTEAPDQKPQVHWKGIEESRHRQGLP